MRIGITADEAKGLDGNIAMHFGQAAYFVIVDVADGKVSKVESVKNTTVHGGGGCVTVDALMAHKVTHVVSGGMGGGAQQKFASQGVKICGASGNIGAAVAAVLKNELGGLGACTHAHEDGHSCH